MSELFSAPQYALRRKILKILGASFHVYAPDGSLLAFSAQKAFKLKEDISVFADKEKTHPLLRIQARSVIDFSAAYDIVDSETGAKVGVARRKGLRSLLKDSWEILDEQDRTIGQISEDSTIKALLRRFLSNLIPQHYRLGEGSGQVTFHQSFNPFVYKLNVNIGRDCTIDSRLIFGVAVLLAAIEGRQN